MKNRALSAAVAVSLAASLALPTYARADSRTAALVRKVKPAVVQVITYDASGKASKLGTGFFVNAAGDVITCRHVMEGATGANVRTSGGVDYPVAGIVAEDVDGDMVKVDEAAASGVDLLGEMAEAVNREIAQARKLLDSVAVAPKR